MAFAIRSKLSARTAKAALFINQAEDEIINPWSELRRKQVRKSVGEQLLRHMNTTGRFPGFAMFHTGMQVRLTQSVEPPEGVVDATGKAIGIELHPLEPESNRRSAFPSHGAAEPVAFVVVLSHQPLCVLCEAR